MAGWYAAVSEANRLESGQLAFTLPRVKALGLRLLVGRCSCLR